MTRIIIRHLACWGVLLMTHCLWAETPLQLSVPPAGQHLSQVLDITVPDIKGSYTFPYLQSERELRVRPVWAEGGPGQARVTLRLGEREIGRAVTSAEQPEAAWENLAPGEYTLRLEGLGDQGAVVSSATWERVGVGTVIAAIGDSITEGYHGHGFWQDDLNLRAEKFPPAAVSRDGRNFPQYSPTTWHHKPTVNTFQSWLTSLNDRLAAVWGQPVFIANEGYGGITSGATLRTMQGDKGWQGRMKLLRPTVWLIHLGVNDERHKVTVEQFAANMEGIVEVLLRDYQAAPERILIARPSYDYAPGMAEVEQQYILKLDELIARRGLRHGPDFFAAYATDRARWYGTDPVHPNLEGIELMAQLWAETLVSALPKGYHP
jgi:lysophospholipase L1-like esterase